MDGKPTPNLTDDNAEITNTSDEFLVSPNCVDVNDVVENEDVVDNDDGDIVVEDAANDEDEEMKKMYLKHNRGMQMQMNYLSTTARNSTVSNLNLRHKLVLCLGLP